MSLVDLDLEWLDLDDLSLASLLPLRRWIRESCIDLGATGPDCAASRLGIGWPDSMASAKAV